MHRTTRAAAASTRTLRLIGSLSIEPSRIAFASSRTMSSSPSDPITTPTVYCSANSDVTQVTHEAKLLTTPDRGGRWHLTDDGKGLERRFRFKTFKATWDFMNTVAAECKVQKHHPEWSNVFNKTKICWTTHQPEGLSGKDTGMARFCDEAGERHGEVVDPEVKVADCGSGGGKV